MVDLGVKHLKRIIVILLILIAAGVGISYYLYHRNLNDLPAVRLSPVTKGKLEEKVYSSGKISPVNKQEVRLLATGVVKTVAVSPGSKVKRGDLLLELDTKELDLQVRQAQAALDVARANESAAGSKLAQVQKLAPGGVDEAQAALRQAQAMVKQAQAARDIVQNQRNNARVTAALDGTVLAVNVEPGQPVPLQTSLIVVGDLSQLIIQADVNEVDASKLAVGQSVKITGATLGDKEFSGKVAAVYPMAQLQTSAQGTETTVQVRLSVDQADPALKPGFTVSLAAIVAAKDEVTQVPLESVFTLNKEKFVYIYKAGEINKVKVQTGIVGDLNTEVSSGLSPGEEVVINPSKDLKAGMKVKVE